MFKTEAIKQRIDEMGCNTTEIAQRAGISRTFLSYAINNRVKVNPTIEVATKIGQALGFNSFDEFLEMPSDDSPRRVRRWSTFSTPKDNEDDEEEW